MRSKRVESPVAGHAADLWEHVRDRRHPVARPWPTGGDRGLDHDPARAPGQNQLRGQVTWVKAVNPRRGEKPHRPLDAIDWGPTGTTDPWAPFETHGS